MKITVDFAKKHYGKGAHGWNHINRVYKNCLRIAETVNCDLEVVKASALLHDIARFIDENDEKGCHAKQGAEMSKEILKNLDYTKKQKENIIYCIKVHRYSKNLKPEIIEAKILQDADRLDALGAMIIIRAFYNTGKYNGVIHDPKIPIREYYKGAADIQTPINHFYEKILKITPQSFHTKKGQELAKVRYDFVKKFIKQFLDEWDCKI